MFINIKIQTIFWCINFLLINVKWCSIFKCSLLFQKKKSALIWKSGRIYIYCAQNLAGALYREFNNVHLLYRFKAFNEYMYRYMYSFIFSFYTIYSYFLLILLLYIAGSSGFSIWHRNNKITSEISWLSDWSDNHDILHDRWPGIVYNLSDKISHQYPMYTVRLVGNGLPQH